MVSDKIQASVAANSRTTAAVIPVYWCSSPKAVSGRAKTYAFGRRKHGRNLRFVWNLFTAPGMAGNPGTGLSISTVHELQCSSIC